MAHARLLPGVAPAIVPITGHAVTMDGSSSTQGGQNPASVSLATLLTTATSPGSTQVVTNEGKEGAGLLGTGVNFLQGQVVLSISGGLGSSTRILQWDVPNNYSVLGGPEVHRAAVSQTSLTGTVGTSVDNTNSATFTGVISGSVLTVSGVVGVVAIGQQISGTNVNFGTYIVSGAGTTWTVSGTASAASTAMTSALKILGPGATGVLNVLDNIFNSDPTVISGKRFLLWNSTPNKYPDGWLFSGQGKPADMARQARLGWADYPGQCLNALDYWRITPPRVQADQDSIDLGQAGFLSMRCVTEDHLTGYTFNPVTGAADPGGGYGVLSQAFIVPFVQSIEGGLPFFAFHHYYSNQSTAQTINGYVTKLEYTGSISGCSFWILNRDRSINADFGIIVNGTSVEVHRISSTVLKQGYYDIILRVQRGNENHYYRHKLGIGSLTVANNQEMTLDGYEYGYLWSIDNAGTSGSPLYTDNTSRNLRGVSNGPTFSLAVRIAPTLASTDGCQMYLLATGVATAVASTSAVQIIRDSSNRLQVIVSNDSGANWTGTLRTPINTFKSGTNAMWILLRCNGNGTARWRMTVIDDTNNTVLYDSGDVAPGQTVVQYSAKAHSNNHMIIGGGILNNAFPYTGAGSGGAAPGAWVGKVARLMLWTQEIDWLQGVSGYTGAGFAAMTAGTSFANTVNFALLRAGNNQLTDFSVANGGIVGDGRTLTITAGATGSFSGTCAPFFALSGNAADFMKGIQYGTSCALDGEEPGNPSLLGGTTFEVIDKREWQSYTSVRGIAVTT